jgi:ATP/ADP translocase
MGAVLLLAQVLVLCMLGTAALMFGCKALINKHYLSLGQQLQHTTHQQHQHQQQQQQQGKASWGQVLAVLRHNPTAAALATSVVGFSVSYRMFEYSYKGQVGESAPAGPAPTTAAAARSHHVLDIAARQPGVYEEPCSHSSAVTSTLWHVDTNST